LIMPSKQRVSIIIINWNGLDDTIECLKSLSNIIYTNYRISVIDNGSTGNDADILEENFGDSIHVIRNDKNYGFTGACNRGIRQAEKDGADYVLLLNNDTVVAPDFLTEMVKVAESNSRIGITGGKIYSYGTDRIQFVWGGMDYWLGQHVYTPRLVTEQISKGPLDKGQYNSVRDVDWTTGCCMLIKMKVIQDIGALDGSYFSYYDDVEFCARARKNGYRAVYAPMAKIWHKGGQSSGIVSDFVVYHGTRNRFWFMQKYSSKWQYCCFNAYFFGLYIWFAVAYYLLICRKPKLLDAFIRGIRDGLPGNRQDQVNPLSGY